MSLKIYKKKTSDPDSAYGLHIEVGDTVTSQAITGLLPATGYTFKMIRAINGGESEPVIITATTQAAPVENTTPEAPGVTADDTANTLAFTHALGSSEIVVSINNGTYAAYAGPYSVGDVARAAGYYKAKIKAATGRNESAVTSSPAFTVAPVENTTPAAPTVTGDDELNILTASHALGDSEILYSENNAAYQQYTGALSIGDVARPAGYWQFKVKAATGRNESATADSPAFTVTPVSYYPAPAIVSADDSLNSIRFTPRSTGQNAFVSSDNYRYYIDNGPLLILQNVSNPAGVDIAFVVGNIDAAANAVHIVEVNNNGVAVSNPATVSIPFTSGWLDSGLNIQGNSIFVDAGLLHDPDLPVVSTQVNTYMETLLQKDGHDWTYFNSAVNGRKISTMLADGFGGSTPTATGLNSLGSIPRKIMAFGEWINEHGAGTSKETVYQQNKDFAIGYRAAYPGVKIIIVGPTEIDRAGWSEAKAYWYTMLNAEWSTYADAYISFEDNVHIGIDGANSPITQYRDSYRVIVARKPGFRDDLHQDVNGQILVASEIAAASHQLAGEAVPIELSAITLTPFGDVIRLSDNSKGAVEWQIDGGSWFIGTESLRLAPATHSVLARQFKRPEITVSGEAVTRETLRANSNQLTKNGTWSPNTTDEYQFSGAVTWYEFQASNGFQLIQLSDPSLGALTISVDGVVVATDVPANAANSLPKILFEKADLGGGSHTIRVANQSGALAIDRITRW